MKLKITVFFITIIFRFTSVNAQTDESIGNWNVLVLKGKIAEKYFYNGEFNFRKSPSKPVYDYSEYKLVFGRMLSKTFSMNVGAGAYNSNPAGSFLQSRPKESRLWLDFLIKNSYKRLFFDQRIRIEQRFNNTAGAPNRIRYRPLLTIPVNHSKLSNNTFFFSTSNDLYFGTGNPTLELNMFFLGGGYKVNDRMILTAGNMNNYDFRKTTDQSKNYLYLTLVLDLTAKKHIKSKESATQIFSGN